MCNVAEFLPLFAHMTGKESGFREGCLSFRSHSMQGKEVGKQTKAGAAGLEAERLQRMMLKLTHCLQNIE